MELSTQLPVYNPVFGSFSPPVCRLSQYEVFPACRRRFLLKQLDSSDDTTPKGL